MLKSAGGNGSTPFVMMLYNTIVFFSVFMYFKDDTDLGRTCHGVHKHTAVNIDYMRVEIVEGLPVVKSRMFDTHAQNS